MQVRRVAVVFAAIVVTSAAVGAAAGLLCAAILVASAEGVRRLLEDLELYRIAAVTGAACGIVLGPLVTFSVLRHVPVGRFFVEATVATAIAGAAGFLLDLSFGAALAVATGGFLAAVGRVAWIHRRRTSTASPSSAG